jgi:Flp pilus assembly protein TadD
MQISSTAISRAKSLYEAGDYRAAIRDCQSLLAIEPQNHHAAYLLARCHEKTNDLPSAINILWQLARHNPRDKEVALSLGAALVRAGEHQAGLNIYQQVLQAEPENPQALVGAAKALEGMGSIDQALAQLDKIPPGSLGATDLEFWAGLLEKRGNTQGALQKYQQAIKAGGETASLLNKAANACQMLKQWEQAKTYYERSLELYPDHALTHHNLGVYYRTMGKSVEAHKHFTRSIQLAPHFAHAYYSLAFQSPTGLEPDLFRQVKAALQNPDLAAQDQIYYWYALGRTFQKNRDYGGAYQAYARANSLDRNLRPFDRQRYVDLVNSILKGFDRTLAEQLLPLGNPSSKPIFILGMPRSSTSLIEQVLASHPKVTGLGELYYFTTVYEQLSAQKPQGLGYPVSLKLLPRQTAHQISGLFLADLEKYDSKARHLIDKQPMNFLHLGLIAVLFPNARFIHCQRNPLDTCLSNYFHWFPGSFLFSNSWQDLALVYKGYLELMSHWKKLFGHRIFDLSYEGFLGDQEGGTRRLLEFCGLEWNQACMEYHRNTMPVQTHSTNQVRQALFTSSKGRWKRYEPWLSEAFQALKGQGITWR